MKLKHCFTQGILGLYAVCLGAFLQLDATAQPVPPTRFTVKAFEVEGMKTLDRALAQDVLKDYLDRPLSFAELEKAAQLVAELYREHDYFTVTAYLPKQELNDGQVTIKVVESTLQDLKIEGNTRYSDEYLQWMLEPVKEGAQDGLPRRSVLQRQLFH